MQLHVISELHCILTIITGGVIILGYPPKIAYLLSSSPSHFRA